MDRETAKTLILTKTPIEGKAWLKNVFKTRTDFEEVLKDYLDPDIPLILPSFDKEKLITKLKLNNEYLRMIEVDPLDPTVAIFEPEEKKHIDNTVRDYSFDCKREMPDEFTKSNEG